MSGAALSSRRFTAAIFVLFGIPLATSVFGEEGTLLATMMVAIVIPVYNITAVVILELFGAARSRFLFD